MTAVKRRVDVCPIHGMVPLDSCTLCRRTSSKTYVARSGMSPTVTANGELVFGGRGPDIYARPGIPREVAR